MPEEFKFAGIFLLGGCAVFLAVSYYCIDLGGRLADKKYGPQHLIDDEKEVRW